MHRSCLLPTQARRYAASRTFSEAVVRSSCGFGRFTSSLAVIGLDAALHTRQSLMVV